MPDRMADDPRLALYDDLLASMDWRDRSACLDGDMAVFFPGRGESCNEAKAICAGCPVIDECREYAIDRVIRQGVFGGLSERERRHMRHLRKCASTTCANRAHIEVVEAAPEWVSPWAKPLWHAKRSPRRATFGSGSAEAKRVGRALAAAAGAA